MKKICFILFLFSAPLAAKAWDAQVEGPDVFGNVKVVASESRNLSEGLVVQCDTKGEILLAYIFRKKEFDSIPTTPATLLISTVQGNVLNLKAELRNWNDNYAGIVASEVREDIIIAIESIKSARSTIEVGAELAGNQVSGSFSSRGSSRAMDKVLQDCKLKPTS